MKYFQMSHQPKSKIMFKTALFGAALMTATPSQAFESLHAILDGSASWPGPKITYSGKPIEMRLTNPWPPVSQLVKLTKEAIKSLERASQGKIIVKAYHTGTLVPFPHGFKSPRTDIADFSACYSSIEKSMTGQRVFGLPGVLPPVPAVGTRIMNEIQVKYFNNEFRKQKVLMLPSVQTGAGYQLMSRKPIESLADLKGMKIAVTNRLSIQVMKAWGGVPTKTKFGDLHTSLSRKTTDAIYWLDEAMIPMKFSKILKNRTVVGMNQGTLDFCANPKWIDSLPRDLRETVALWGQIYVQSLSQIATTERTKFGHYDKAGVRSVKLASENKANWRKAVQPMYDAWIAKATKKGYPAAAILADLKALGKKYAGKTPDQITKLTVSHPVTGFLKK